MWFAKRLNSAPLLSFEQVQSALQSRGYSFKGLQQIALEAVVGSEGRWHEFSRNFEPHPRHQERLQRLLAGGPEVWRRPIEVFQIDQVYFVRDGHHRVTLARRRGDTHIAALVTQIVARAEILPSLEPEELLARAELSAFLQATNLDQHCQSHQLEMHSSGLFGVLLDHIQVHGYYLGVDYGREFSLVETAASWFDLVYLPVVRALEEAGAPAEFPRRTMAELYLWLTHHREQMRGTGLELNDTEVAQALVDCFSERPGISLIKGVKRVMRAAWKAVQESPEPPRPGL